MFKKTCVQRISAIITAVGMVVSMTSYNMAKASEIEINKVNDDNALVGYETNANNLVDDYDEDSELCQKLELDYENSTTDLSEEREKELNEIGVFDSDIEAWDDDMIEKINNAYAYSMSVMYYGENHEDGTLEELTVEETDEVIKDVYGEELEEKEEKDNIFEQALGNTVFGAVKASAKSSSDSGKEQSVDSGKVKQMIACIQTAKDKPINVIYTISWLVRPSHKKFDIAGIYLGNASPNKESFKAHHKCLYRQIYTAPYVKEDEKVDYYSVSGNGMSARYGLFNNNLVDIKDEVFVMSFDCTIKSRKNQNYIEATGVYYHCKVNKTISPGVSIGSGGISLSVSGGVSEVYSFVPQNPYVKFFPK